jgi:hypothetical protein
MFWIALVVVLIVLGARTGSDRSAHQTALNRINRKHFDFVLCEPGGLSVLCAIDLNYASHQQKHCQERDDFLAEDCRIAEAIAGRVAGRREPAMQAAMPDDYPVPVPENEIAPLCPRCAGTMVKLLAKGGDNAGKEFWGCSNFPKCREIVI